MSRVISQRKVTKKTAACMHGPPAQSGLLRANIFMMIAKYFCSGHLESNIGSFVRHFACGSLPFLSSCELGYNIRAVHLALSKLTASDRWCGCSLQPAR